MPLGNCRCCGHKNFKGGNALCNYCFHQRLLDSCHTCEYYKSVAAKEKQVSDTYKKNLEQATNDIILATVSAFSVIY
jgi:hypothetical protein